MPAEPKWQVLGVLALAATLRLYQLGANALYADEAFSAWVVHHSIREAWGWVARLDAHPPLYYTLLQAFTLVLGHEEYALRLPSAVFGTLSVGLVYRLGRIVAGHSTGLLTAFLVAISPFHVIVSQQTRMYALLTMTVTLAMIGFASVLRQCTRDHTPPAREYWAVATISPEDAHGALPIPAAWVTYVVGTTAAMWTNYTAIFLPAATTLVVLVFWGRGWVGRAFLRSWLLAYLAIAVLMLPLVPILLHQLMGANVPSFFPFPTFQTIANTFRTILLGGLGGYYTRRFQPFVFAVVTALIGLGLWGWRRDPRWSIFVLALGLTPFAGELVVSFRRSIFLDRTLIWTAIPLFLALAVGVRQVRRPFLAVSLVACLVAMDMNLLRSYYWGARTFASWDRIASYVEQRIEPNDLILFAFPYNQLPFDYYFSRRCICGVAEHGVPADFGTVDAIFPQTSPSDLARVRTLVATRRRIWVLDQPPPILQAMLDQLGQMVDHRVFQLPERFHLYLYQIIAPP